MKNISTKSSLLAPYNTLIQDDDSENDYDLEDSLDDLNNPNIILENDVILIKNKVKEFNLNYELNNNTELNNKLVEEPFSNIIKAFMIIPLIIS